jgi:hypothetical protein
MDTLLVCATSSRWQGCASGSASILAAICQVLRGASASHFFVDDLPRHNRYNHVAVWALGSVREIRIGWNGPRRDVWNWPEFVLIEAALLKLMRDSALLLVREITKSRFLLPEGLAQAAEFTVLAFASCV